MVVSEPLLARRALKVADQFGTSDAAGMRGTGKSSAGGIELRAIEVASTSMVLVARFGKSDHLKAVRLGTTRGARVVAPGSVHFVVAGRRTVPRRIVGWVRRDRRRVG